MRVRAGLILMVLLASPVSAKDQPTSVVTASWYGRWHQGRKMANGRPFNPLALTAASRTLPLGTRVLVTNLANGRSVVVTITDRGPFRRGRGIDVSLAAAMRLGMMESGLARVRIEVVGLEHT